MHELAIIVYLYPAILYTIFIYNSYRLPPKKVSFYQVEIIYYVSFSKIFYETQHSTYIYHR